MSIPKHAPRKPSNAPGTQWYSTADAARKRPRVGPFTLSKEAADELRHQADEWHDGNVSAAIEAMIWAGAPAARRPPGKP